MFGRRRLPDPEFAPGQRYWWHRDDHVARVLVGSVGDPPPNRTSDAASTSPQEVTFLRLDDYAVYDHVSVTQLEQAWRDERLKRILLPCGTVDVCLSVTGWAIGWDE